MVNFTKNPDDLISYTPKYRMKQNIGVLPLPTDSRTFLDETEQDSKAWKGKKGSKGWVQ